MHLMKPPCNHLFSDGYGRALMRMAAFFLPDELEIQNFPLHLPQNYIRKIHHANPQRL
jgi:hypothetical protein